MLEQIWIDTPDAESAAFLMRDTVGRLRAQLVQCSSRGWRVLVLADRDLPPVLDDVIALVRSWLRSRGMRETTLHIGSHGFTVRVNASPA